MLPLDLTDNVNVLAGNLTDQVRNIAKVTTLRERPRLSPTLSDGRVPLRAMTRGAGSGALAVEGLERAAHERRGRGPGVWTGALSERAVGAKDRFSESLKLRVPPYQP